MSIKPTVSIVTITYNHSKCIKQAIESLMMQKTDFDFEIIIADDYSTDGTTDIIEDYVKTAKNVIKPIFRNSNIGAWNNCKEAIIATSGKYVALCEGDDYWTDPLKLQKQVDYMEANKDCSVCFHPVKVIFEDKENEDYIFPITSDVKKFNIESLLRENFIQTNSVMYRRQNYDNIAKDVMPGDWYLHLYHARFGSIGFINEVMSVYRRHHGGIWWKDDNNKIDFWKKNAINHIKFYYRVLELIGDNDIYVDIVKDSITGFIDMVMKDCSDDKNLNIQKDIFKKFSSDSANYAYKLLDDNEKLKNYINSLESHKKILEEDLDVVRQHLKGVEHELEQTLNSKGWIALQRLHSIKHKFSKSSKKQ